MMTSTSMLETLAFISMPGGWEWLIVLAIGLLIFGRRLPDVGRSIGKTVVEFRKGIREVEDDIKSADTAPATPAASSEHQQLEQNQSHAADSRTIASGSIHPEPAPKPE